MKVLFFFLGLLLLNNARLFDPEKGPRFKKIHNVNTKAPKPQDQPSVPMIIDSSTSNVLANVIAKARHSVVQIVTTSTQYNWVRPWETSSDQQSAGSGFFIELEGKGFILTNGHVVEQAVGIVITLPKFGKELFAVRIHSVCHDKDVALLVLEHSGKAKMMKLLKAINQDVVAMTIADSDKFPQGSVAIAVGYPLGHPNLKASTGILAGNEHVDSRFYLQVTSPINPGNSGGPLLNSDGQVMGINTAAIESASNVGYSLPTNHFIKLLTSFVKDTPAPSAGSLAADLWASKLVSVPDVLHSTSASFMQKQTSGDMTPSVIKRFPVLGVDLTPATATTSAYLGYQGEGGVYVAKVQHFGLFRSAGVQPGDLLLEFNGHTLDRFGETQIADTDERLNIYDLSERFVIGEPLNIKVWRDKAMKSVNVPFEYNTSEACPVREVSEPVREKMQFEVFGGLVFMPLTLNHVGLLVESNPGVARYLDTDNLKESRVVVSNILSESTSIPSGAVIPGDVVKRVNGKPVSTLEEYRKAFKPSSDYWVVETENGGLIVLKFDDALKAEPELCELNGYVATQATAAFLEAPKNKEVNTPVAPEQTADIQLKSSPVDANVPKFRSTLRSRMGQLTSHRFR